MVWTSPVVHASRPHPVAAMRLRECDVNEAFDSRNSSFTGTPCASLGVSISLAHVVCQLAAQHSSLHLAIWRSEQESVSQHQLSRITDAPYSAADPCRSRHCPEGPSAMHVVACLGTFAVECGTCIRVGWQLQTRRLRPSRCFTVTPAIDVKVQACLLVTGSALCALHKEA